jgi:hypothetical protein
MSDQNPELAKAAYHLAEEIWAEKWSHVRGPELIQELQRRCPGFTTGEYKEAFADGLHRAR